jgi:hypothetical protein
MLEQSKFRVAGINVSGRGDWCTVPIFTEITDRLIAPEFGIESDFKKNLTVRGGDAAIQTSHMKQFTKVVLLTPIRQFHSNLKI